jgi:hypothetical protein
MRHQHTNGRTLDTGAKADAEATSANTTATVFIIFDYILIFDATKERRGILLQQRASLFPGTLMVDGGAYVWLLKIVDRELFTVQSPISEIIKHEM